MKEIFDKTQYILKEGIEKTKEMIIAQNPEISNIHIFPKERELEITQKR